MLVPVADSSEDIETACITDVLVRAGAKVTVASVMPEGRLQVTMARGLSRSEYFAIDFGGHPLGQCEIYIFCYMRMLPRAWSPPFFFQRAC